LEKRVGKIRKITTLDNLKLVGYNTIQKQLMKQKKSGSTGKAMAAVGTN
jgi:hypothetical protein